MSLTLVATPIGNLGDLSPRAAEALRAAEVWIVEDTRVSAKLQTHLGIKRPMRVLNDHTPEPQVERLVAEAAEGAICLVTDGGAPGVSDPGAALCDRCRLKGIPVQAIPGPSAAIVALMLSGFYAQRFVFLGFLGRKAGDIRGELAPFRDSALTVVLFESPHRIDALLAAAYEALGERRYAICREMSKAFEQVYRGFLPDAPPAASLPRKGEVTIVVEGRRRTAVEVETAPGTMEG